MKMTTSSSGGNIDDEAFARIKMGVNVDIKRSDGKKERKKERRELHVVVVISRWRERSCPNKCRGRN